MFTWCFRDQQFDRLEMCGLAPRGSKKSGHLSDRLRIRYPGGTLPLPLRIGKMEYSKIYPNHSQLLILFSLTADNLAYYCSIGTALSLCQVICSIK